MFHRSFYVVCSLLIVLSIFEGFTSPFLPLTLQKKGISNAWTGAIFSAYPLFHTIVSPITARFLECFSHRTLICAAVMIMAVSMGALGLICLLILPSADVGVTESIILLIIARSIGGVASGMANTTILSFAPTVYPDDTEEVVAYIEACVGIGVIIGPVLGYFVYDSVGLKIFLVGALASLPYVPLVLLCVPSDLSTITQSSNTEKDSLGMTLLSDDNKKPKAGYKMLLLNSRIVFGTVCYFLPFFAMGAFQPILSLHIKDTYHFKEKTAGAIFALPALTFVTGTIVGPYLIPQRLNRRKAMTIILVLLAFSFLIAAPAFYKLSLTLTLIGIGLVGFFLGPIVILPLPEMINSAKQEFKSYDMEHTTNMLSGLANSACGMGEILGPLYSGVVYNAGGYQMSMFILSGLFSLIAVTNIVSTKFITLKHDPKPGAESTTVLESGDESVEEAVEEVAA